MVKDCKTCESFKFSLPTQVCNDCGTGFANYIPITDESDSATNEGYSGSDSQGSAVAEIKAWCATNEVKPKSVHDIAFEDTKADSYQHWLTTQMIRRCKIIIYDK